MKREALALSAVVAAAVEQEKEAAKQEAVEEAEEATQLWMSTVEVYHESTT